MDSNVVDGDDIRMSQRPRSARFLCETLQSCRLAAAGADHLDGHITVELVVVRQEHAAHSAAPDLAHDEISCIENGT